MFELTVTADSPLVGMSLGEAEALHDAPLLLALKTGNESRLAPPADARIWVGSVLGVMGPRAAGAATSRRTSFLRMSLAPAQLRRPVQSRAAPAFPKRWSRRPRSFIGKTARRPAACASSYGISLLAINRDKKVLREDVRNVPLRAGDMLVFHSIWTDLARGRASNRDFVVVTDYPKGEQRPHKFKIAMAHLRRHDAARAVLASCRCRSR